MDSPTEEIAYRVRNCYEDPEHTTKDIINIINKVKLK